MFDNIALMAEQYSLPDTPSIIFKDIHDNDTILVNIFSYLFDPNNHKHFNNYGYICKRWQLVTKSMKLMYSWYTKKILALKNKPKAEDVDILAPLETNVSMFDLPKQIFEMPLDQSKPCIVTNQRVSLTFLFPKLQITLYKVVLEATNNLVKEYVRKKVSKIQYDDGFIRDDITPHEEQETAKKRKSKLFVPPSLSLLYNAIAKNGTFIILNHGGYYATSQFDIKGKEVRHKTFHKYVSRKKQGGRQITQDKAKKANSIGSQIRRKQEEHFKEELEEHLIEWYDYIRACDVVFVHAPGPYNESLLFEFDGTPLDKSRCFTIPLNTQQPTNSHVLEAATKLFNFTLTLVEV
jgi:hypothetical protein